MNIDKYTLPSSIAHCAILASLLMTGGCTTILDIPPPSADAKKLTPIMFVNGLSISEGSACDDMKRGDWPELYDLFETHGYKLSVACIAQNGSIDDIARELYEKSISSAYSKADRFHIVAKSLGGLVVRRALNNYKNELANRILSITTISTPHHGSVIADYLVNGRKLDGDGCMTTQIGIDFNKSINLFGNKDFRVSGQELTQSNMERFNINNPRDPGIPFFSFGYKIDCSTAKCNFLDHTLPAYPTNGVLECFHNTIALHGKTYQSKVNDGLVTPASASYGDYIGTFEGDHFSQTTQSSYKYRTIWKDVFERVIVNLKRLEKLKT